MLDTDVLLTNGGHGPEEFAIINDLSSILCTKCIQRLVCPSARLKFETAQLILIKFYVCESVGN
jgi:hypothetical protein